MVNIYLFDTNLQCLRVVDNNIVVNCYTIAVAVQCSINDLNVFNCSIQHLFDLLNMEINL